MADRWRAHGEADGLRPRRIQAWVRRGTLMVLLLGLGLVLDGWTALAATTVVVTSTGDSGPGTLRDAIASASSGDTVTFAIPPDAPHCDAGMCQIWLSSGELVIDKDLSIIATNTRAAQAIMVRRSPAIGTPRFRVLRITASRTVQISGLTVLGGSVDGGGGGGGIANLGTLTLFDVDVSENWSTSRIDGVGGGIYNLGTLTVINGRIERNHAGGSGGGIANLGTLTMTNSVVSDNYTDGMAGGILTSGTATVTASAFIRNHANDNRSDRGGGAIFNQIGTLRLTNSSLTLNTTRGPGGAIVNTASGTVLVSHTTISANDSAPGTGGIASVNSPGLTAVKNSILQKAGSTSNPSNCQGVILMVGHNRSNDGSCPETTSSNPGPSIPQDDGGFTPSQLLTVPDDAIDAVAPNECSDLDLRPLTTDQRGVPRPQGSRCDAGAYEMVVGPRDSGPPVIVLPTSSVTVLEDRTTEPVLFAVADSDQGAGWPAVTVVGRSDNQARVPDDRIVVAGLADRPTFRQVRVSPAPNANGYATIAVTVTDENARAASVPFTLNVLPVNDAPSFTRGPDVQARTSDGSVSLPWATGISAGPTDESSQGLTFLVTSSQPALFDVQPGIDSNGTLSFTPAANADGTATVTVVLKDTGGTADGGVDASAPQTFALAITPGTLPTISIADAAVVEGNAGTGDASLTVTLSAASAQAVTVHYATANGSATAGTDFLATSGSLVLQPGELLATVVVPVLGDTTPESGESFTVTLANPSRATLGRATATVTIADDDSTGGTAPTPTPTATPTSTASPSPTPSPPPAASPSPTAPPTRTVSPTPTASPSPTPSPSPTSAPASGPCTPRPSPAVHSEQLGPGRLRVTVTAQTSTSGWTNALSRLEVGAARNARVEVPGAAAGANGGPSIVPGQVAGTPGNFDLLLPAGTQQVTFIVQRVADGDFRVDFVVVDGCHGNGAFRTFVGGGPGVR